MNFRPTFRQQDLLAWWLRAMLCGIGMFYGISLLASEYLAARGWHEKNYVRAMLELNLAARIMPFDHRLREYPVMKEWKHNNDPHQE